MPCKKATVFPSRRDTRLQQVPSAAAVAEKAEAEKKHYAPKKMLGIEMDLLLKNPERAVAALQPLAATRGTAAVLKELQQGAAFLSSSDLKRSTTTLNYR